MKTVTFIILSHKGKLEKTVCDQLLRFFLIKKLSGLTLQRHFGEKKFGKQNSLSYIY